MDLLEDLRKERNERRERFSSEDEEMEEHEPRQVTCRDLLERFGDNYVARLTTYSSVEVDEIMSVCEETLKSTGPGGRYCDMRCRVIIYLSWLTSGWTIRGLSALFKTSPSSVQSTISYVMSGLTYSHIREYLPG